MINSNDLDGGNMNQIKYFCKHYEAIDKYTAIISCTVCINLRSLMFECTISVLQPILPI